MLSRHEVDLVVAGRPPDGLRGELRVRAISPNNLIMVGPLAVARNFEPSTATWLLREPASGTRSTMTALLDDLAITPPQMVLGSHGAVVSAAVAGLGITLVSRQAVQRELKTGALVELPLPGTPLNRPWHVVSQSTATMSTELLIDHLVSRPQLGWRAVTGLRRQAS